ncbi:hypothetical protein K504DRAFT_461248 [Pleomassaria siparia CBS 279.74]|uniref:F-box domain-containing protein n=1 Tax=Pleomassaria siparia CBS 279.74 TaxID=1314801 RepID=A0A6G1JV53_9PLEO|nr:hypothetical protein K504DRAFT_461248 [Pleomassaria siparia CBS 279.74]
MDRDIPSRNTAFNTLPIELNKSIAHYLDSDRDIASFQSVCRATLDATLGDKLSFWRAKFRERYAYKKNTTNLVLKKSYQVRQHILRNGTGFHFGMAKTDEEIKDERKIVGVMRELINESFSGASQLDKNGKPHCPNLAHIAKFAQESRLFVPSSKRRGPPKAVQREDVRNLAAIRLMASHFLLSTEFSPPVYGVHKSQVAVYEPTNKAPIFTGPDKTEVNMEWLLHVMNHFRNHMKNHDAGDFCGVWKDLSYSEKPSPWRIPLEEGCQPLGKHWKSTFSYLDPVSELPKFRLQNGEDENMVFVDHYVDEGNIQHFKLDSVKGKNLPWPETFEDRLQSHRDTLVPPQSQRETRAQKSKSKPTPKQMNEEDKYKSIQLIGDGGDEEDDFVASGWLQALHPQCGIPGWQRMTLMKHFLDENNQPSQDDHLWAYEGVVLPGGRIILGRWWLATDPPDFDNDNSGPFIMWAVDGGPEIPNEDEDEDEDEDNVKENTR